MTMVTKEKILVVDDELALQEYLRGALELDDYSVITANNGEEALKKIEEDNVGIMIVDWNMPVMDGWHLCRKIRGNKYTKNIPVIMLTSRTTKEDEIIAIESGADDFIRKPVDIDILRARVKALLRRVQAVCSDSLESCGVFIDLDRHEVKVNGDLLDLWPKEFDLLYYLMKNDGNVVTRENILEDVWGYQYFGTTRAVDATIKRLREKMGDFANRIVTVKGIGYKFSEED